MRTMIATLGQRPAGDRSWALQRLHHAGRIALSGVLSVPAALFAIGLAMRLLATSQITFALTEGSAYYLAVARNLAAGRGFEIDAIWSYATPPLILPRPAFELWQPLASVIAALPMTVLGPTFASGQLAFVVLGAAIPPMTYWIARDIGKRLDLAPRRAASVALGSGIVAAISGPLLLATVVPDSTLPFAVLALAASLVMARAVSGSMRDLAVLGVLLGLAYLTRMEAVYLGGAFVLLALAANGMRGGARRSVVVAAVAALVALPWWLRNLAVFGSALPGQLAENAFLTNNEQIFAYSSRPTMGDYFAQGPGVIASNVAQAAWHNLVNVLLVPGGAIALTGLVTLLIAVLVRRRLAIAAAHSPLGATLLAGGLTFVATTIVFPVATLWGTFEHASGAFVVGLIVAGSVGADAVVARVRSWRAWPRSNAWLAPAAMITLSAGLAFVQLRSASDQARAEQDTFAALASNLPAALERAGVDPGTPIISDRAVWLSDALARPVLALPVEPLDDILRLARRFGAQAIVVVERGAAHAPDLAADTSGCLGSIPLAGKPLAPAPATVFSISETCR